MDALELLQRDHQKLKTLFDQVAIADRTNDKKGIFKKIKRELQAYVRIEEGIFYPAIEEHEPLKLTRRRFSRTHRYIKTLLREIDHLISQSQTFEPKLKILMETVERRNEEECKMFARVRELVDNDVLERLGQQFQMAKGNDLKSSAKDR